MFQETTEQKDVEGLPKVVGKKRSQNLGLPRRTPWENVSGVVIEGNRPTEGYKRGRGREFRRIVERYKTLLKKTLVSNLKQHFVIQDSRST